MNLTKLAFMQYDRTVADDVRRLFVDYPHKDYQLRVMGVSKDLMADYLHTTLMESGMQTICLRDNGNLVGLIALQFLPWMSEHFGLRMYAVRHLLSGSTNPLVQARLLRFVIEELVEVDFLDCRIAADDIFCAHALEICGFRYVGTEIFLGKKLTPVKACDLSESTNIHDCSPGDQSEVLKIVEDSHIHNRFVYDPLIDGQAARSLYRRLVAKCFDQPNFKVFVEKSGSQVQGFIVSKINKSFGEIVGVRCGSLDFIGVRPEERKHGLGLGLNNAALRHMFQDGLEYAGVRTLVNNYPAMRNCFATGFAVTSSSLHFHKWIRRAKVSQRNKALRQESVFWKGEGRDVQYGKAGLKSI